METGGLARLYVFCKGGNHEVGCHSFFKQAIGAMLSEKRAQAACAVKACDIIRVGWFAC